jgi:ATP-dependent protease Clp ATPase subunit
MFFLIFFLPFSLLCIFIDVRDTDTDTDRGQYWSATKFFSSHYYYSFPRLPSLQTNRTVENIGARRLHTVIERIVEEISFDAPEKAGEKFEVTEDYVKARVGDLLKTGDLRKYIL